MRTAFMNGTETSAQLLERLKQQIQDGAYSLAPIAQLDPQGTCARSLFEGVVLGLRQLLSSVPRNKLPWSAIRNILNVKCKERGYNFESNRSLRSTNQDFLCILQNALAALQQWSPGNQEALTQTSVAESENEDDVKHLESMYPVQYPQEPVLRVIPSDFPQRVYRPRQGQKDAWRHWGQRKLMMNEIEFLTLYACPNDTVVYAGSAPGTHIAFLSKELFPEIRFILIDPAPFAIEASPRIELINDLFTEELALEFSNRSVLFVSDIRRTFESEDMIAQDMKDQQRWHEIMNPKASMFKFRHPWTKGETEYLSGDVFTQPYAPARSTETRLVVTGRQKKRWNHTIYEQQCFFFNSILRKIPHRHGVEGAGFDPESYDSASEVEILKRFLDKKLGMAFQGLEISEKRKEIAKLSIRITKAIGGIQAREWLKRCDQKLVLLDSIIQKKRKRESSEQHL
jgi:hypothetical protein